MAEAGVSVKLPQFWRQNPEIWFETAEAQFTIAKITADETKYAYVLLAIDETAVARTAAARKSASSGNKYETLKSALLEQYRDPLRDRASKLFQLTGLGDRRPSHLLMEMQALVSEHMHGKHEGTCPFFEILFLRQLPEDVRKQMGDVDFKDLSKAGKKADEVWTSVNMTACEKMMSPKETNDSIDVVASMPSTNLQKKRRQRGWCENHVRYATQARKCNGPCTFVRFPDTRNDSKNVMVDR